MKWTVAAAESSAFREATERAPGWYWILRPRMLARRAYDGERGVLSLVHVDGQGALLSPLADLRALEFGDLTCVDEVSGRRYVTYFAGPVRPGEMTGAVRARVVDEVVQPRFDGDSPKVPGWSWCRTNPEAPLQLVDERQIGPVFLEHDAEGVVRVYLAADTDGHSVDVGEFGFSEPLVSRGGVIDESGELGRAEAEFFGPVPRPPPIPPTFRILS